MKFPTEKYYLTYLHKSVGPPWYQELSVPQILAANELLNSIHLDEACLSFINCFLVLQKLGVNPIPSKTDLRFLIKLCRKSDLAFLWFAYQMFYKHDITFDREGKF